MYLGPIEIVSVIDLSSLDLCTINFKSLFGNPRNYSSFYADFKRLGLLLELFCSAPEAVLLYLIDLFLILAEIPLVSRTYFNLNFSFSSESFATLTYCSKTRI